MYHYPLLSRPDLGIVRGPGPGFGNLLFPIGRALQEAQNKKQVFVRPTIFNFKLGPILRMEKHKRFYHNELISRNLNDWMNFFRINIHKNKVKFHCGDGNYFYDIEKSNLLIKNWLLHNSIEKPFNQSGKIAVHIRRGDFKKSNKSHLSHQIPTQWYLDIVERILNTVDKDVVIYSDSEISKEWLKFGYRVKFSQNKTACSNILSMSSADYLIASRSTFSLWSYFFSKQKTFFPKGFELNRYLRDTKNISYV